MGIKVGKATLNLLWRSESLHIQSYHPEYYAKSLNFMCSLPLGAPESFSMGE